jgi:hypothetical protein
VGLTTLIVTILLPLILRVLAYGSHAAHLKRRGEHPAAGFVDCGTGMARHILRRFLCNRVRHDGRRSRCP